MNVLVETLERSLLERFQEVASRLRREHQNVVVDVTSFDAGELTKNPSRSIAIECLFRDAPATEANLVALVVFVEHPNYRSWVSASVSWGEPSRYVEDEFRPQPVELSSETLQELYAALPHLYESLESAMIRKKPKAT